MADNNKELLMSQFLQDWRRISHLITRPEDRKLFADKFREWRRKRQEDRETRAFLDPYWPDEDFSGLEGPVYIIANGGLDAHAFRQCHRLEERRWPYVRDVEHLRTLGKSFRFILFPNADRRSDIAAMKDELIKAEAINIMP